jgi:hypothetical protein
MATDIRRMSKDDLDRLNAEARAWRDRDKRPEEDLSSLPAPIIETPPATAVQIVEQHPRAASGPAHMLLLLHPPVHQLVHSRLHACRRYAMVWPWYYF